MSPEDQAAMDAMANEAKGSQADGQPASQQPQVAPPAAKPVEASVPTQTPPSDSMAQSYQNHKDAIDSQAAFEQMQQEAKGGQVEAPASGTATAGSPPTEEQATPQRADHWVPGASMVYDADKHQYVPDPNVKPGGKGLADLAKDMGQGALEAPVHGVVGGARDAFEGMLSGAQDLLTWGVKKAGLDEALKWDQTPDWHLPEVSEPSSTTGKVVRSVSQFLTSMWGVGKVLGDEIPSTLKGAAALFAGFEGKQKRLSDLIESVPALDNPVTSFLSSKPDDNEALGRLKNAVEGLGIGAAADALVSGIRMLKGGTDAQGALEGELKTPTGEPATAEPPIKVNDKAFETLGDPNAAPDAPLVSIAKGDQAQKTYNAQVATDGMTPEEMAGFHTPASPEELAGPSSPGATQAQAKEPKIYVNFARIDSPDDVKRAMSQMADNQAENIDAARRGIQSFEDTKLGANSEDAWATLMDRRQGQPLGDTQMLAARQLWQQSAVKTTEVMQQALDNPTPENLLAFRKQWTTHAMIQQEVIAARTEVARSLSAMRIPVGGADADRLSSIVDQLQQSGGLQGNLEFLQKVKSLADAGDLEGMGNVAEKSMYARTRDALQNAWTNGLISNPLTHVKVALSNASTIALRLTETRIAEAMDKLLGNDAGVAAGETAQTTAGLIQGIKDAFRFVGKSAGLPIEAPANNAVSDAIAAFKTSTYHVGDPEGSWSQSFEDQLASDTNQMSDSGWLGKGMDMLGQVIRTPGRALTAEHEFFRSMGMRMELNRFAIRQATQELNAGRLAQSDFQGRIAELIENPPAGLTEKAVDGMTYQTFTDAPGKLAESIEKLRNDFPMTRFILPFYKIPSRILSFTFERSPLAPLMSRFRAEVAAGGARQSMALAQMGLGTSVMLASADAVMNGQITGAGPHEKGQRMAMENEGWLPYSIKVGDRWVQYNRLETIGSSMAMAADVAETIRDYQSAVNTDDPDVEKLTVAATLAVANDVTSKTYLQGLSNFFEMMADPKSGGESAVKNLAGSAVPAGVAAIAKADDPYNRQVNSMLDAIKARTPGVSKDLPPQRNVWGEPVSHESGLGKAYDAFVPFATRQSANEPIDKEILRLGMNVNLPAATTTINSAKVNLKEDPKIYSRYVELAGNETKDPLTQMGTKDTLNALVSGSHPLSSLYNMRQDEGKQTMIEDIIRAQRDRAKKELLQEYPDLQEKVNDTRDKQQALKSINVGGP